MEEYLAVLALSILQKRMMERIPLMWPGFLFLNFLDFLDLSFIQVNISSYSCYSI